MNKVTTLLFFAFLMIQAEAAQLDGTSAPTKLALPSALDKNYARDYVLVGYGELSNQEKKLLEDDEHYTLALEYLNNSSLYLKKTAERGLSHDDKPKQMETIQVPDYGNAVAQLELSIGKYSNPVSAYIFRNIIKAYYGTQKKYEATMIRAEEILYRHGVCEGYIDYGKRIEGQKQTEKALAIYREGMQRCVSKNPNSWAANVLAGRVAFIEKIVPKK